MEGSNIPKIILWLVILLMVAGLGTMVWYWFSPRGTTPGSTTSYQNSYSYVDNNSTTVTTPSGTGQTGGQNQNQASSTATIDFAAAYAQLFQTFGSHAATFTSVGASATGDLGVLYAFYTADAKLAKANAPAGDPLTIDVAMADLTGDGANEAIVYENLPGFCGSAGCTMDFYQKQSGKWHKFFTQTVAGEQVGLTSTLTDGYLDLLITVRGSVAAQPNVMRYVWNGTTYKAKKAIAVWDGVEFLTLP